MMNNQKAEVKNRAIVDKSDLRFTGRDMVAAVLFTVVLLRYLWLVQGNQGSFVECLFYFPLFGMILSLSSCFYKEGENVSRIKCRSLHMVLLGIAAMELILYHWMIGLGALDTMIHNGNAYQMVQIINLLYGAFLGVVMLGMIYGIYCGVKYSGVYFSVVIHAMGVITLLYLNQSFITSIDATSNTLQSYYHSIILNALFYGEGAVVAIVCWMVSRKQLKKAA